MRTFVKVTPVMFSAVTAACFSSPAEPPPTLPASSIHYDNSGATLAYSEVQSDEGVIVSQRSDATHIIMWNPVYLDPAADVRVDLESRLRATAVGSGWTEPVLQEHSASGPGITALATVEGLPSWITAFRCPDRTTLVFVVSSSDSGGMVDLSAHSDEVARITCGQSGQEEETLQTTHIIEDPQWEIERDERGQAKYVSARSGDQLYVGTTSTASLESAGCLGVATGQMEVSTSAWNVQSVQTSESSTATTCTISTSGELTDSTPVRITVDVLRCPAHAVIASRYSVGAPVPAEHPLIAGVLRCP